MSWTSWMSVYCSVTEKRWQQWTIALTLSGGDQPRTATHSMTGRPAPVWHREGGRQRQLTGSLSGGRSTEQSALSGGHRATSQSRYCAHVRRSACVHAICTAGDAPAQYTVLVVHDQLQYITSQVYVNSITDSYLLLSRRLHRHCSVTRTE